jgi:hypothetical protein
VLHIVNKIQLFGHHRPLTAVRPWLRLDPMVQRTTDDIERDIQTTLAIAPEMGGHVAVALVETAYASCIERNAAASSAYRKALEQYRTNPPERAGHRGLALKGVLETMLLECRGGHLGGFKMSDEAEKKPSPWEVREKFIHAVYDEVEGQTAPVHASLRALQEKYGFERLDIQTSSSFWSKKYFLSFHSQDGVSLTPEGIEYVEERRAPATTDVASVMQNVQNVQNFNGPTVIQQGDNNRAHAIQNSGATSDEIGAIFRGLKGAAAALPPERRANAVEVVAQLEAEAKKPKWNDMIVAGLIGALKAAPELAPYLPTVMTLFFGPGMGVE